MLKVRAALCLAITAIVWDVSPTFAAIELLNNPGFESGTSFWIHNGFTMQTAADEVHGGVASVKCTGRTNVHQGPSQTIHLQKGAQYSFKSYIKVVSNNHARQFQTATVKIMYDFGDGTHKMQPIVQNKFISSADGWVLLGADFNTPNGKNIRSAHLHIDSLLAHTDFYLDDCSLTQLQDDPNWETKADQRIENLRKSNLHVDVTLPSGVDPNDVTVQLNHLKHSFGWGSVVRSDWMIDPDYSQYRDVVKEMFNWATIQDYKWKYDRGNRTNPDYSVAVAATDVLNQLGLKVRGHCMFWAVAHSNPDWAQSLSGPELKQTVEERINYMTNITRNKLGHWDVNNELLHGRFYEQHTGNPSFTETIFQRVHQADPTPTLFLNDYAVVARGQHNLEYISQIEKFKAANVGLGGVGLQSHFIEYKEPSPAVLNARLDLIASAGLPMWITELDMTANDETTKAEWLARVLKVYFAHPGVHGVILWGFWDHDMREVDRALVQGYGFQLRESGERYMKLVKETWSTNVNTSLTSGTSFNIRGFRGDYEAIVWYKGNPVQRTTFTLGDVDQTLHLLVPDVSNVISLPKKTSPFNVVGASHPSSLSPNLHSVGSATSSTAGTDDLVCTSRRSRVSAASAGEVVEVQCLGDEVMTSCSSVLKNNDWHRKGEMIRMLNRKPACKATDGYLSTAGVQAVARCCLMKSLTCDYLMAGPSESGVDDRVEVPCPINSFVTGCSTQSGDSQGNSDGSLFTNTSCISQNDDPRDGVISSGSCCHGPGLQCHSVVSGYSGLSQADKIGVTCPANYVMAGCNVFSQHGRTAGAYIANSGSGDTCYGVNGQEKHGGETGVQAYASCCRVTS